MINVSIIKEKNLISGFMIRGHAGYAESGKDIICSAVSAIAYTAIGAIDEFVIKVDYKEEDGEMEFFIPLSRFKSIKNTKRRKKKINNAQIILKTFVLGLKQIEQEYYDYLIIHEGGVKSD